MKIIVAVDNEWGIGKNNGLLFKLKEDMKFFRTVTTGKVVAMGANTFKSLPNGALPNRTNIVLDDTGTKHSGTISCSTVAELDEVLKTFNTDDVFVIGGAGFYKLMLNRCNVCYVTKVYANGGAEVFFPNLDNMPEWHLAEQGSTINDNGYDVSFCRYEK